MIPHIDAVVMDGSWNSLLGKIATLLAIPWEDNSDLEMVVVV
jgi:hypothetical protein